RGMLAVRQGKPVPPVERTRKVTENEARALVGRYRFKDKDIEITNSDGRVYLLPLQGGQRTEIRGLGADFIVDDVTGYGPKITRVGDKLKLGADAYERVAPPVPQLLPEKWRGLIGEYGPDHNILYILEKDGKLYALIEWVFLYPLEEVTPDVYKFPSS